MANTLSVEELRIGNWVIDGDSDYGKITSIHKSGCVRIGTEAWGIVKATPIVLSPEVLEKCGFVNQPYEDVYKEYRNSKIALEFYKKDSRPKLIVYDNDDDYGQSLPSVEIKYLHQLQNLYFALTGKELIYKP